MRAQVNQDSLGKPGSLVQQTEAGGQVWTGALSGGRFAAVLVNLNDDASLAVQLDWNLLPGAPPSATRLRVRDLWNATGGDLGLHASSIELSMAPHGSRMVVLEPPSSGGGLSADDEGPVSIKADDPEAESSGRWFAYAWGLTGAATAEACTTARSGLLGNTSRDPRIRLLAEGTDLGNISVRSADGFGFVAGCHLSACAGGAVGYSTRRNLSTRFSLVPAGGRLRYGSPCSLKSLALDAYLSPAASFDAADASARTGLWTLVDPDDLNSTRAFGGGLFALRLGRTPPPYPADPPAWDGIDSTVVFHHGMATRGDTENNYCIRIPVMVATGTGTLLAFAESRPKWGRADGCNPLQPPPLGSDRGPGNNTEKNIILSRSTSNGAVWEAPITICRGCSQPQAVFDRVRNRTLLLSVVTLPGTDKFVNTQQSDGGSDGREWSPVRRSAIGNLSRTLMTGPGTALQLGGPGSRSQYRGRLVANGWTPGMGQGTNQAFFSDSGGDRWEVSRTIQKGVGESQLVETAEGVIIMLSRNWVNCQRFHDPPWSRGNCIGVSNSSTGGMYFTPLVFDGRVLAQESQISAVRSAADPSVIYFSGPTAIKGVWPAGPRHRSLTGTRAQGRVQASTDGAWTFNTGTDGAGGVRITGWHDVLNAKPTGAAVESNIGHWSDAFGYSSLANTRDGLGLLFESGSADCIGPYSLGSSGACAIRFARIVPAKLATNASAGE